VFVQPSAEELRGGLMAPSAGVQGAFGQRSDTGFDFGVVLCGSGSWT